MSSSIRILALSSMMAFTAVLCLSVFAAEDPVNLKPLSVMRVKVSAPTSSASGKVSIFFNLAPGHHAYIQQFKLEALSPAGIVLSEPLIDPVVDFTDPVSKKTKKGASGSGTAVSTFEIPSALSLGDSFDLKMVLTYQACTKSYCLFPTREPVEATVYLRGDSVATSASVLSASEKFASELEENFWLTLLLIFGAGILTSFTPCIFPMIPITLAVLGARDSGKTRLSGFILSLFYVLGIALTYAVLGVIAAKTGALFGALLGHPVVVIGLACLFIAMAFSMFGFFEIKLPDRLTNKLLGSSPSHSAHGIFGAFVSGLVAGVVASPCVGPVLVSILAYVARSADGGLGFLLLFVYAIGFGQIFLVMGTFSQLIKRLPRSGPWLDKTKFVFGTVMIGMALYVVWPVARPLIFPDRGVTPSSCAQESADGMSCVVEKTVAKPAWVKYSDAELASALKAGRVVIIDFQAEWCQACHELERETFSDPRVLEAGREIVWLAFDATQDSDELAALRAKYEILGLPFVTFYDSRGVWRKDLTLTGFEDAEAFLERLKSL